MERRVNYKGFVIDVHPYQFRDISGWSAELEIEKHDGEGVTDTHFFFRKSQVFETEEAAIQAAIAAGRRAIDVGFTPTVQDTVTG